MVQWKWVDAQTAEQGLSLLRRLADHGYEGYFVGGCVRDELLGRPINDMDIATNATPEQVIDLFEHTVPTGIAHGTVTVIVDGEHFELTTYRTESQYVDHRRPEQVEFVSDLYEDLRRRDFTMNAIARGLNDDYVDPFNGRDDLAKGIIRCVGEAEERFEEDALRMLRGIRFASVFDFELEHTTWQALVHRRELISYIAAERIRVEMEKMIAGPHPLKGVELLRASGLVEHMKIHVPCPPQRPELLQHLDDLTPLKWNERIKQLSSRSAHEQSLWEQTFLDRSLLTWTLIALSLGLNADHVRQTMKEWTFANVFTERIARLIRLHEWLNIQTQSKIQQLFPSESSLPSCPDDDTESMQDASMSDYDVKEGNRSKQEVVDEAQPSHVAFRIWTEGVIHYGREAAVHWLLLHHTLSQDATLSLLDEIADHAAEWLAKQTVWSLADVNINGQQVLAALDTRGGAWLGQLMNEILLHVAVGDLVNDTDTIVQYAVRRHGEGEQA
ncbi:CCA tRNA nucleotidyltransferase [Paenibacillus sp. WLX1005]|uniref:CCA tRNA nucleotidyltransferase n=1 Tax=Paenibacillus sp. WLX1005 TaxID=3243766 RepID=UPI00398460F0